MIIKKKKEKIMKENNFILKKYEQKKNAIFNI
jgi:hypothetical protein